MATEKLSTVNGVDICVGEDAIYFYLLDIESPVTSQQIVIPIAEWSEVVDFIIKKLNQNVK